MMFTSSLSPDVAQEPWLKRDLFVAKQRFNMVQSLAVIHSGYIAGMCRHLLAERTPNRH